MVTDRAPPNVTGLIVSSTTLPEYSWSATVTALKVTGWVPKTLEKRTRIRLPQRSGWTPRGCWRRGKGNRGRAEYWPGRNWWARRADKPAEPAERRRSSPPETWPRWRPNVAPCLGRGPGRDRRRWRPDGPRAWRRRCLLPGKSWTTAGEDPVRSSATYFLQAHARSYPYFPPFGGDTSGFLFPGF